MPRGVAPPPDRRKRSRSGHRSGSVSARVSPIQGAPLSPSSSAWCMPSVPPHVEQQWVGPHVSVSRLSPLQSYYQIYFVEELLKRTSLAELKDRELLEWLVEAQRWIPYVFEQLGEEGFLKDEEEEREASGGSPSLEKKEPQPPSPSQRANDTALPYEDPSLYLYADATPPPPCLSREDGTQVGSHLSATEFRILLISTLQTLPWWRIVEDIGKEGGGRDERMNQTITLRHEKITLAFEKLCYICLHYDTDAKQVLPLLSGAFQVAPLVRDGAQRRLPVESFLRVLNFIVARESIRTPQLGARVVSIRNSSSSEKREFTESLLLYVTRELLPKPYWNNRRHHIAAVYLLLYMALEGEMPAYTPPGLPGRATPLGGRQPSAVVHSSSTSANPGPNNIMTAVWKLLEESQSGGREAHFLMRRDGASHKPPKEGHTSQDEQGDPRSIQSPAGVVSGESGAESTNYSSPTFDSNARGEGRSFGKIDGVPLPSHVGQMLAPPLQDGGESATELVHSEEDPTTRKKRDGEEWSKALDRALHQKEGGGPAPREEHPAGPSREKGHLVGKTTANSMGISNWISQPQNNRLLSFRDTIIHLLLTRLFRLECVLEPSAEAKRQYHHIITTCFRYPQRHSIFSTPTSSLYPSTNVSTLPSPVPHRPSLPLSLKEESMSEEERMLKYAHHMEILSNTKQLQDFFTPESIPMFKTLRDCALLAFSVLQEDMQKQILAGECGNRQWWSVVSDFFFNRLIVDTSPIVNPVPTFVLGPSAFADAEKKEREKEKEESEERKQWNSASAFYKSVSYVLIYLAPSLSLYGQNGESVGLLHNLAKIVIEGRCEESAVGLPGTGGRREDRQPRASNLGTAALRSAATSSIKGRRGMVPPTHGASKETRHLVETQRLHTSLFLYPLFRFVSPSLSKEDGIGILRRLLKWVVNQQFSASRSSRSMGSRRGSSHPHPSPSLYPGSAFGSPTRPPPEGFHPSLSAELTHHASHSYSAFDRVQLVVLAQCAAIATAVGESIAPRYKAFLVEREEWLKRLLEEEAEEQRKALETPSKEEEEDTSSDEDSGVPSFHRHGKRVKENPSEGTWEALEAFLKTFRNEYILEPFIERFKVTPKGTLTETKEGEPQTEDRKEETVSLSLQHMEVEGLLRSDLFQFCPWPLPQHY